MIRSTGLRFVVAIATSALALLLVQMAHAATYTVTNAGDAASASTCNGTVDCSLRQAIIKANADATPDTIAFNIPGSGVHKISPATSLPTISQPLTINGYAQPGASANTLDVGDNARIAIQVDGDAAPASGRGLSICASGVTVRGLSITRFKLSAIFVGIDATGTPCVTAPTGTMITGNFVGLEPDGTTSAGQSFEGIVVAASPATVIGGTAPALRNIISGNSTLGVGVPSGINLNGADVAATVVQGNYIGTDASGTLDRGNNGAGIVFTNGAANATIGGAAPNRIAYNTTGILVGSDATQNDLTGNDIYANGGLGIDLVASGVAADGVTANDATDLDSGGNALQNFPVITAATRIAGGIHLVGTLPRLSVASANFTFGIHAGSNCDAGGNGEGERFLGSQPVSFAVGSISFSFNFFTDAPLPVGTQITATATNASGNTSEFSACAPLDNNAPLVVTNTNDDGAGSLRQAILDANTNAGGDTITFAIPGDGVHTIAPLSALPPITGAVTIDGYTQPGSVPNSAAGASNAVLQIEIDGISAGNGSSGLDAQADDVGIRGISVGRFDFSGILLNGGNNAFVEGCFVGLRADGTTAFANTFNGIDALGGTGVRIGGAAPEQRNVVSSNSPTSGVGGIRVVNAGTTGARIDGNLIGTDKTGTIKRGNGGVAGILVRQAGAARIGLEAPNLISGNSAGIVADGGGTGNTFYANDIVGNAARGIDLENDGVTANDLDDADAGTNNLQNFPVLDPVLRIGGNLRVSGSLDVPAGVPTQPYLLAFYASAACDSSGNGEGAVFLGVVTKSITNATENFTVELAATPPAGSKITSTATIAGSTSEFSACANIDTIFENGFE